MDQFVTFLRQVEWAHHELNDGILDAIPRVKSLPELWPLVFQNVLACVCPLQWTNLRSSVGPTVGALLEAGGLAPWNEDIFNVIRSNGNLVR